MDYVNINDFTDAELVARMRRCNSEKFKTLVRMHLSFELDLNTDEFDLPFHEIIYEDKGKIKKWNKQSKKSKQGGGGTTTGCTTVTSKSGGNSPTNIQQQQIDAGFLMHLKELKAFLLQENNITQEGLFRKTGAVSRQNELRLHINNDKPLNLQAAGFSAHDCATVFKGFLADLPEPLLTDSHYPAHRQIAPLCGNIASSAGSSASSSTATKLHINNEEHILNSIQLLLLLLPEDNFELLKHIIEMLHAVSMHERSNKMSADNLATLFTPHLICMRDMPPEVLHYTAKYMSNIIANMIEWGMDIFDVPGKLATDIRAYFLERKRKKTMSPEQTLDESISDISTVNTVYTFVDRVATAAAAMNNNTTDTELAQLYAHIQSMPESSKKRRLIKQFNKQNGQGTPLQLVVMNRLKNNETTRVAKSLSDSIKKHIFHKSIISRTPKRLAVMTPVGVETPNFSNAKQPKLRVLFQSPTTSTSTMPAEGSNIASALNLASTCAANGTNSQNTPYNIKTHPLQNSISSTSLLKLECSSSSSSSSSSSYCITSDIACITAPVVRQHSYDIPKYSKPFDTQSSKTTYDLNTIYCTTPHKLISAASKQLIGISESGGNGTTSVTDKKSVAWDESHLLGIEEYSNPCTPVQQSGHDLKSRYKSEPNLSLTPSMKVSTTTIIGGSKSLTRKLMKGVSLGNLRFPFSTPESTKRLVRSVSSTLKRRQSSEEIHVPLAINETLLENVDNSDFEDNDEGHHETNFYFDENNENNKIHGDIDDTLSEDVNLVTSGHRSSTELNSKATGFQPSMHTSVYHSLQLITSTPSLQLGRRSMSPITKSTQRMPKAMQESIMTPRSRKPVMILAPPSNCDVNQTIEQTVLSSFREQDEDDSLLNTNITNEPEPPVLHCEDATSLGGYSDILRRQHLLQANQSFIAQTTKVKQQQQVNNNSSSSESMTQKSSDALSNDFKEYLLTRSVLTASPVDSSFTSQPDDFGGAGSTTQYIDDLDESQLSRSLLYCLDGYEPPIVESKKNENEQGEREEDSTISLVLSNSFMNNGRKRTASTDLHKFSVAASNISNSNLITDNTTNNVTVFERLNSKDDKENFDGFYVTKKLLISADQYPDETSL